VASAGRADASPQPHDGGRSLRVAFAALFVLGAGLRVIGIWQPIHEPGIWHDTDLAAIARNFHREGMNPLYPRIDWRGDGSGYAEMELPLISWVSALFYPVFGEREQIGRGIAYGFSLGALAVFFRLARQLLPPLSALAAGLFFALSPLVVGLSSSIQPEMPMLCFSLLSVHLFVRWLDGDSTRDLWLAAVAAALAILAKLPAAHVGLLFAALWLAKQGPAGLARARPWLFAAVALAPAAAWYAHARGLYLAYGNSLGVSNEYHWAGWDLFTDAYFVRGIARHELAIWTKAGLALGLVSVVLGAKLRVVRLGLVWLAAAFVFYLVAARTTADGWAAHYHVFSVPPVALLFGAGLASAIAWTRSSRAPRIVIAGLWCLLALGLAGAYASEARGLAWRVRKQLTPHPLHRCALDMSPHLVEPGLVVVSGASARDAKGYPLAVDAPYMLYWLDRKGFALAEEDQSLASLRALAARGARYFVAEKKALGKRPGFEAELRATLAVRFECDEALLLALDELR